MITFENEIICVKHNQVEKLICLHIALGHFHLPSLLPDFPGPFPLLLPEQSPNCTRYCIKRQQVELHQVKKFCTSKETSNRMKRQPRVCTKNFASYSSYGEKTNIYNIQKNFRPLQQLSHPRWKKQNVSPLVAFSAAAASQVNCLGRLRDQREYQQYNSVCTRCKGWTGETRSMEKSEATITILANRWKGEPTLWLGTTIHGISASRWGCPCSLIFSSFFFSCLFFSLF